jgi:hypothetical protein
MRPVVGLIQMDTEAVALCAQCIAAVVGEIEDENGPDAS